MQIVENNIYVENYILKATVKKFSDIIMAMENMLFLTFDKRLALFLLEAIENGESLTIRVTHEEIAKNIGSAREVVTRALKEFSKEGIVELSRGRIKVLDLIKLSGLANRS